jgi:antirestriction protein
MWKDPIVDEVRQAREEYAARFNFDLEAIARDLREHQEELERSGWNVVSLAPRRVEESGDAAA